jgi:hypothetical protein
MPLRHRQATEEDLAQWPALFITFARRPQLETHDEIDNENDEHTDGERREPEGER